MFNGIWRKLVVRTRTFIRISHFLGKSEDLILVLPNPFMPTNLEVSNRNVYPTFVTVNINLINELDKLAGLKSRFGLPIFFFTDEKKSKNYYKGIRKWASPSNKNTIRVYMSILHK